MNNDARNVRGFRVERTRVLGTHSYNYSVWEPMHQRPWLSNLTPSHTTISAHYGRVGTRTDPDLVALPQGASRDVAWAGFRAYQYALAYALIREAYAEDLEAAAVRSAAAEGAWGLPGGSYVTQGEGQMEIYFPKKK